MSASALFPKAREGAKSGPGLIGALALGSAVLLSLIWFLYGRTLSAGFTLDDFSHIGYAWQTFNGHPEALVNKLFGSWTSGKEDGIVAYRPTTCATFVIDYAFWQAKAYGFHLSNLFFFFLDCLFTGLVSYKLMAHAQSSRLSAGLAGLLAAFLMALYPGHPDSVVTVVGRVDALPTAFYLASLYLYILYREKAKRHFLCSSLLCFWLALGSKETAVTLPAILLLGELLGLFENTLSSPDSPSGGSSESPSGSHSESDGPADIAPAFKTKLLAAARLTAPYFIVLTAFAILRLVVLHGQVGGYGKVHFKALLRQLLGFGDRATLAKILLPINEHFPLPATFSNCMLLVYALSALNLICLASRNKQLAKLALFLILFAVANVLLTFQIWHIFPNLVGFRLFFLSSSAFCSLLSLGLFVDKKTMGWSCCNLLAALFLGLIWGATLLNNIWPFEVAGREMLAFQLELNTLAAEAKPGQKLILTELPQDYCGSPMIGRASFLAVMLKPPVNGQDIRKAFVIEEGGKLIDLDTLQEYSGSAGGRPKYKWDKDMSGLTRLE